MSAAELWPSDEDGRARAPTLWSRRRRQFQSAPERRGRPLPESGLGLASDGVSPDRPALTREPASRSTARPDIQLSPSHPQEIDPLYLFARHLEWERQEEPSAAWDLLAAAQSPHNDTRAHARALLASSHQLGGLSQAAGCAHQRLNKSRRPLRENTMKCPMGSTLSTTAAECTPANPASFASSRFSLAGAESG